MLDKFSEDLKKSRELKNISLIEVADRTKLHIAFLENLENGNFDFQPQTYIRAFLKQYAKAIGTDPDIIIKDYDLAKSGKYVSQFAPGEPPVTEDKYEKNIKPEPVPVQIKKPIFDEPVEKPETKKKILLEEDKEEFSGRPSFHKDDNKKFRREHFVSADNKIPRAEEKSGAGKLSAAREISRMVREEKAVKSKSLPKVTLSSPLVKNILLVIFILIVILGLYSLVNILLKESSGDDPEVKRQNFEDVVKEQEQRLLGKKSEEEILDSIRKAEDERLLAQEQLDSIVLKVISIAPGSMTIAADSSGMKKPDKITYGNNEIGVFKAKHFFVFTSDNTPSIKVTLNDKPVEFDSKKVDKVRITRDGVVR